MPLGLSLARRPSGGRGKAGLGGLAAARRTRAHTQPQRASAGAAHRRRCLQTRAGGGVVCASRARSHVCPAARDRVGPLARVLSCALSRALSRVRFLACALALALSRVGSLSRSCELSRVRCLACALSHALSRARECALSRACGGWDLASILGLGAGAGGAGWGSVAVMHRSKHRCLCVWGRGVWVGSGVGGSYTLVSLLPDDC